MKGDNLSFLSIGCFRSDSRKFNLFPSLFYFLATALYNYISVLSVVSGIKNISRDQVEVDVIWILLL